MTDAVYLGGIVRGTHTVPLAHIAIKIGRAFPAIPNVYLPVRLGFNPYTMEGLAYGWGMIEGETQIQGVPAGGKVVALTRRDMRVRASTKSDGATGRWRLYPLVKRPHFVATTDARLRFNAAVYDGVMPVDWEPEA